MNTYCLASILRGGTFTAVSMGVYTDWWTQFFGNPQICAMPCYGGEVNFGASTAGVCAYFCFFTINPFDAVIDVEATAGAHLQIYVNPVTGSAQPAIEATSAGPQTVSFPGGLNTLAYICSAGPIIAVPQTCIFDPQGITGRWVSPFYPGRDPFFGPTTGPGSGSGSGSLSSTGPSTPL